MSDCLIIQWIWVYSILRETQIHPMNMFLSQDLHLWSLS